MGQFSKALEIMLMHTQHHRGGNYKLIPSSYTLRIPH